MPRAGDHAIPSEKQILQWLASIEAVQESMRPYLLMLSRKGRMRRLKPRRGGEKVTTVVAGIAIARNLKLSRASPEDIEAHETRAMRLQRLKWSVDVFAQSLTDTIMVSKTKAWWTTTALYTALRGLARHDVELTRELEPARKFFALGRRKPKPATK